MENIKLKKLDNGITLITEHLPNVSTFSMGFFIKTGAINETKKESGISHFIEHLMFKGTKNRTAKEISEFVDFEGVLAIGHGLPRIALHRVKWGLYRCHRFDID